MTSESLLKAIGAADDAALLRCERPARRPFVYIAVAACAVLAITIGLLAPRFIPGTPSLPAENSTTATTVATTTSVAPTTAAPTTTATTTTSTKQPTKTSSVQIPLRAVCLTDGITPSEWVKVPDTDREMATLLSEFSVSLLKNAYSGSGNHVTAPLTLYTALSMLYNGADGTTADQMRQVMGASPTFINERLGTLLRDMHVDMEDRLMQTSTSLWLGNCDKIPQSYLQTVVDAYDSEVFSGEFSLEQINEWVNEKTRGRIPELLGDPLAADMYLLAAQVYTARWKCTATQIEMVFNEADGSQTATDGIRMDKNGFCDVYVSEYYTTAVCPMYGSDMIIIMPHEGSLSDLISGLRPEDLTDASLRGGTKYSRVELEIPQFSVNTKGNLKTVLSDMGMPEIFNRFKAHFGKMGYRIGELAVNNVTAETTFSVDDKGVDAASAAAIYPTLSGKDPIEQIRITIDRPFFYAVVDSKTHVPLYVGVQETMR